MGMYIPLNSAIVITMYQESQKIGCALPTTLTKFYSAMTQAVLFRYLRGHPQYETAFMPPLNDLPPVVSNKFSEICKLAYRGIVGTSDQVQLIFSGLPSDFDSLGLMDSVTELYVTHGAVSKHHFVHVTFQKYFAAFHISSLSPTEQLEHFKRQHEGKLKVMLRFLAGLTKLNTITSQQLRGLLGEPHIEQNDDYQSQCCKAMKPDVCVCAHHTNWLFESQNPDLVQSLLHNHTAAFTFTRDMLQLEYYSVGYCIAHSQGNWLLTFEEDTDVEKLCMLVSGMDTRNFHNSRIALTTTQPMSNDKFSLLRTNFNSCIEEMYLAVPKCLSLSNLSTLRILELTLVATSTINILSVNCLESLTITGKSENAVNIESGEAITIFLSSSSSLKEFCVKGIFSDKPMEVFIKGIKDNSVLPLQRLEIHGPNVHACSLSTTASRCLGQFITKSTTLQYFRISNVQISGQGLIALITAIHSCSSLQETLIERLRLVFDDEWSDVSIKEVGASLIQVINDHTDMVDIEESLRDLSATEENNIKTSVIALSCYYCLCINLDNQGISDAGAVVLARTLHHNSTLQRLDLSNNTISDTGAVALAQALHNNSTLEWLVLGGNDGIGEEGTRQLVQALTVNTSITRECGLVLPKRLEEYASQYHAVADATVKQNESDFQQTVSTDINTAGYNKDQRSNSKPFIRKMGENEWAMLSPLSKKKLAQLRGANRNIKQLQHTSPAYYSVNDSNVPQSVRQVPDREHYQSEEVPQRPHLQAVMKSYQFLDATPSQYGSPVNSGISPVVNQFIDYVKTIYKESEVERDTKVVKWPPTPSTVFINLACINRKNVSEKSREYAEITEAMVRDGNIDVIYTPKGPIEFNEIAKGVSILSGKLIDSQAIQHRRVILVEGAPGVGKSTFAKELCRRWARGEMAQQYLLVLLLRLRDDRINKAKSIKELIYHPLEGVAQAVSEELILSYNVHALIILEGFDELPDHCRNEQSIFYQLIAGKLLPLATVLVTSRPWATGRIRWNHANRIYQHIEILGFTSHQITEYIERTLPQDKVSDLKAYLEKHPQIRMGMYIPLNSAIVVTVYQESLKSGCTLPTTLTELYTAMVQTLLLRYLHGHLQYETTTIQTFNDLPATVYTKFSELCKLAYSGVFGTCTGNDVQLIFSGLPSHFDSLGLMDSITDLYEIRGEISYNFLHLTFQEYFAAFHIVTVSPTKQLEHFKRHEEGRLKVVLRFLAGLTKLNAITPEILRGLLGEPHIEQNDEHRSKCCKPMKPDVCVSAHHTNWLFEAQNPDLVQSLLHNHTVAFTFTRDMLQLEYYSVGYCIAHSQGNWLLTFEEDTDVEKLHMIVSGVEARNFHNSRIALKTTQPMSNDKFSLLRTGFNSCIEELYLAVPKCLSLSNLSTLRILELTLVATSTINILSVRCLESLTITGTSENAVNIESSEAIRTFLSSSSSLKEFCVKGIYSDKPMEVIMKGMKENSVLPLQRLEMDGPNVYACSLSTTASRCLGQFITRSTTLQYFRISNVQISGQGLIALITAIHSCSSLQETLIERLRLVFDDEWSDVSIKDVRASLIQVINDHTDMVDIEESLRDLSATEENNIKTSVIALSCYYCLCINLDNQGISDAGAVVLARTLHHNSTLQRLDLSNNTISDTGAVALAQALHNNSTLKWLDLFNNVITDDGAVALAQVVLRHNSTLDSLYLTGNDRIVEQSTHQLVQALTLNRGCDLVLPKRYEDFASHYHAAAVATVKQDESDSQQPVSDDFNILEYEENHRCNSGSVLRYRRRKRELGAWSTHKKGRLNKIIGSRRSQWKIKRNTAGLKISTDERCSPCNYEKISDRDPLQSMTKAPILNDFSGFEMRSEEFGDREHQSMTQALQADRFHESHLQAAVTSHPNLHSTPIQYGSSVNIGISPAVSQFIDYVKTIYKENEIERGIRVVKWPPTPSTVYINLACINRKTISGKSREYAEITEAMVRDGNVDAINTIKGPIEFDEITRGISIPTGKLTHIKEKIQQARVILVEGAPGVGKSTFAREFCRRWERGEIAQQYQLVLLLRLRDDRINKAKSIKELIYHPLEGVAQAVSEELILSYNVHALIILEGFDELPDHCRNEQSIFYQLIAGKLLPLATVLVTSRPWATGRIRWNHGSRIYQHIEILGFSSQQITEYIESTLPQDKVSDLKAYLEKHPQIRMGMYIPLNSAIVVAVYQECRGALPRTLTELYTAMVQTLLLRYLYGHPQYETTTIHTFRDLPPSVYAKFSELCMLAYRGIVGNSKHDIVQVVFTGLPSDFDSLGLMDSVTELYMTQGAVSSHKFIHLAFQEYFAAVHISTLSPAEQLEHFERHKWNRMKVVLRFVAGLNNLSCISKENVYRFLTLPQSRSISPYSVPIDVSVTADLMNWMFEAQSSDVIALALENKTVEFCVTQSMVTLDYYCLGYNIAHLKCQWVLSSEGLTSGCGVEDVILTMGVEGMKMFVAGANTTKQPSGKVVELRGGEQQYSDWLLQRSGKGHAISVLNMLFTEWKRVLHVHELYLRLPVACDCITWPDLSALYTSTEFRHHWPDQLET